MVCSVSEMRSRVGSISTVPGIELVLVVIVGEIALVDVDDFVGALHVLVEQDAICKGFICLIA